jgi:hypothetical protein
VDERRPRLAASVAWAFAFVTALQMAFTLSGLERAMLDNVTLGPGGELTFWPNLVFAYLPSILWVCLYAMLWPLVSGTTARPFMVAALVAFVPLAIIAVFGSLLSSQASTRILELMSGAASLAGAFYALFGLLLVTALLRSGLFSVWVAMWGFAWVGLMIIAHGFSILQPAEGSPLLGVVGVLTSYISPVLLMAFLILLGFGILAGGGVSNKGIDTVKPAV